MNRASLIDEVVHDVRFAVRTLRRNAGFSAIVVGMLAVGIGANTAIFTLVDALLLRELPVPHPEQLIAIGDKSRTGSMSIGSPRTDIISYPLYKDLRDRNHTLSGLVASGRSGRLDLVATSDGSQPDHPRGRYVSANYFTVLGVRPLRGRLFDGTEDDVRGGAPVVVISHRFWTRRFNQDPGVIGRSIRLNGQAMTIIGVAAETFDGELIGQPIELWIPVTMQAVLAPHQKVLDDRITDWLLLLGRLKPGASFAQAEAELGSLIRQSLLDGSSAQNPFTPQTVKQVKMYIAPGATGFSAVRAQYQSALLMLTAGVALLLLIVCANVGNLLLARALARGREMSVRLAIGAGRMRLIRQLMTESLVIALLSAGAGLLVAWWGSHLLLLLAADGSPVIPVDVRLDIRVLAFTTALSVIAVALFGLAPALRAVRIDLASSMRASASSLSGGGMGSRGSRMPLAKLLIAGQVALSVVLLVCGALLVRSLDSLVTADTGLDRDHLLVVEVDARGRGYEKDRLATLALDLSNKFASLPGVRGVTFSENGLFSGTESNNTVTVAGFVAHETADTSAYSDGVGPDYVRAIGGRLLAGRDLAASDAFGATRVALINQTMARFFFGGASPVGKTLRFDDSTSATVVGVLADIKDHDLTAMPVRRFYVPFAQRIFGEPAGLRFEIRTAGDPLLLTKTVRDAITAVDPKLPLTGLAPLTLMMRQSVRTERLLARLAAGFGLLALALAVIGLYGVMTYAVARRTGEIGLRVSLGAEQHQVASMVVLDALRVVGLGIVLGLPAALACARLIRGQLHGVAWVDPTAITAALVMMVLSAVIAVLVPAVRAARVSPLTALRQE